MGLVQSLFCAVSFCVERVLTWVCCAFILVVFMFTLILLMVYGISVGYHYAQKELASFALFAWSSTSSPETAWLRAGQQSNQQPIQRLRSMNNTDYERDQLPGPNAYRRDYESESTFFIDVTASPNSVLGNVRIRTTFEPELSAGMFNRPSNEPPLPLRIYQRPKYVWEEQPQNEPDISEQSFNRPPEPELQEPMPRRPTEPELTPQERDLARRLIGRYRRAKSYTQDTTTVNADSPFMKFIRNATDVRYYLPNVI